MAFLLFFFFVVIQNTKEKKGEGRVNERGSRSYDERRDELPPSISLPHSDLPFSELVTPEHVHFYRTCRTHTHKTQDPSHTDSNMMLTRFSRAARPLQQMQTMQYSSTPVACIGLRWPKKHAGMKFDLKQNKVLANKLNAAFFEQKDKIDEAIQVGRSWTAPDLRRKSFDDLHRLWFILYKERNMLLSEKAKLQRMKSPVTRVHESRYSKVKRSMGAIKHVLRERSVIKRELEMNNLVAEIEHEMVGGELELDGEQVEVPGVHKLADTKPGGISR
eukprot:GSChrysophyteH2.ASY1.ANO1.858.1 assembled CDS